MALAVDTTGHLPGAIDSPSAGNYSVPWNHTCGASANLMLILSAHATNALQRRTVTAASFNSLAGSEVVNQDDGNFERVSIWKVDNPTTGSALSALWNVNVPAGDLVLQYAGYSISFSGASSTIAASNGATGTTANPSTTATGIQAGDIVVAVLANDSAAAALTESGTLIFEDENVDSDSDFSAQYYIATGTTQSISWTQSDSGSGWAIAWAAVRASGAPAGVAVSAAVLPGGLNSLGTGLTRAIMPSGIGNMG